MLFFVHGKTDSDSLLDMLWLYVAALQYYCRCQLRCNDAPQHLKAAQHSTRGVAGNARVASISAQEFYRNFYIEFPTLVTIIFRRFVVNIGQTLILIGRGCSP